jgi:hypothetical protein
MRALKRLHRADLAEKSIADEYLAEEHIVDERMVDERMVDERMVDERMVEASRELSDGVGPLCSPTIKANQRRKTGPEPAPSPSASSSANYLNSGRYRKNQTNHNMLLLMRSQRRLTCGRSRTKPMLPGGATRRAGRCSIPSSFLGLVEPV